MNQTLNRFLTDLHVDQNGKALGGNPKTTHCFRAGVITRIARYLKLEVANHFVYHDHIQTTKRYYPDRLSYKHRIRLSCFRDAQDTPSAMQKAKTRYNLDQLENKF